MKGHWEFLDPGLDHPADTVYIASWYKEKE